MPPVSACCYTGTITSNQNRNDRFTRPQATKSTAGAHWRERRWLYIDTVTVFCLFLFGIIREIPRGTPQIAGETTMFVGNSHPTNTNQGLFLRACTAVHRAITSTGRGFEVQLAAGLKNGSWDDNRYGTALGYVRLRTFDGIPTYEA